VPPTDLANSIKREIRERLLVTSDIKLVNYGSMPRETYKSKLVDFSQAV
jgi:phenylacetate-CoA ligase